MSLSTKMFDFFIKEPVSFWTGKAPNEVTALDAIPVYVAAAFPEIFIFSIASCDGTAAQNKNTCKENESRSSYSGSPGTRLKGICLDKIEMCVNGVWRTNQNEVAPKTEIKTNGFDDDCDGMTDECADGETKKSYSGTAESKNVGLCKERIETCSKGAWQNTQDEVIPKTEIKANGLDDDCDGMTDECADGETRKSYSGAPATRNIGVCKERIETCSNGKWQKTQDEVIPGVENYTNRLDDDCDGSLDEIDISGPNKTVTLNTCSIQPAFISIKNGATLVFTCNSVEINTDVIELDSTSSIEALAQSCGQSNGSNGYGGYDGGGGGGGGHIGSGGAGRRGGWTGGAGNGGLPYGSIQDIVAESGSCGGTGGGPYGASGGLGGGAIKIVSNVANIMGGIYAYGKNGRSAPYDDGGGGGGSGGAIVIDTRVLGVNLSSTKLSVRGGIGGFGGSSYSTGGSGGGGGGGSVELRFNSANVLNVATYSSATLAQFIELIGQFGCYDISGGDGTGNSSAGQPGGLNVTTFE